MPLLRGILSLLRMFVLKCPKALPGCPFLTNIFNGQNIVLFFQKMLVWACQIEILETLVFVMLTLKFETVLPLDALRRQMPSTVMLVYSMDVRSGLIKLAGLLYFYYLIQNLSKF